jgi:hypothetical protein
LLALSLSLTNSLLVIHIELFLHRAHFGVQLVNRTWPPRGGCRWERPRTSHTSTRFATTTTAAAATAATTTAATTTATTTATTPGRAGQRGLPSERKAGEGRVGHVPLCMVWTHVTPVGRLVRVTAAAALAVVVVAVVALADDGRLKVRRGGLVGDELVTIVNRNGKPKAEEAVSARGIAKKDSW